MKSIRAALMVSALLFPAAASAADQPLYPQIAETSHASPQTSEFFRSFFTAKSRHDVAATMSLFSPDLLTYTDAILGWPINSHKALEDIFAAYMPKWGEGRSYPFRIIGGPDSAIVAFIDTPELFGGEIRLIGAVDFKDGKVIRWADYWDSTGFPSAVYDKVRTPAPSFPTDFREAEVKDNADPAIVTIATDLQKALAGGDATTASGLLSPDVVYEDFALRTQLLGRSATERYLGRIADGVPFGRGATLLHVVGGTKGGGFEWRSADGKIRGITAIELNADGLVERMTTTYDGRLLPEEARRELTLKSLERM
ncbi:nuclear transport factor 2 family protein [Mangrovicella endophytica]|uniref:nuclear transport factor 2 family protein n=1 Tax=Mangrovicella endophytica TaxID=2066697 RepID=UPI000C9E0AEC|nr:hypothetical protein [Mangrovicella endophytica]